jgi:hypothetical protein
MNDIQLIKNENVDLRLKFKEKIDKIPAFDELIDLKEILDTYLLAHKDCRDKFLFKDKLCNIATLVLTCATSFLVSTDGAPKTDLDMYIAFGSAFFSGLTNYLKSAEKAGEHRAIILMYTELINKIIKTIHCDCDIEDGSVVSTGSDTGSDNSIERKEGTIKNLCNEYYIKYIELNTQTAKLGLIPKIRKKYSII